MNKNIVALILVVTLVFPPAALTCTTILVGKNASADGSVMVSHSDDGLADGRLITREGVAQQVFYPAWWLRQAGYESGPASYQKPVKRQ